MKNLTITIVTALILVCAATTYAQSGNGVKPILFANLPSTATCPAATLRNMFRSASGDNINLSLENNFSLSGSIISNTVKYSNLQTMIIKLPAFNNSLFSLSKQTDINNNITYVGRIINPLYGDGFQLISTNDGNYQFIKIDLEKILVRCDQ